MNKLQQMGHNIEFHNVGIFDVHSKDCSQKRGILSKRITQATNT